MDSRKHTLHVCKYIIVLCLCLNFKESYEDPHKPLPSSVVHIRGLVDGIMEADLVEALQEFGAIR